jgi:hypothetical protein
MVVLDIDLDFFLQHLPRRWAKNGRTSSEGNPTWSTSSTNSFVTTQLGLDATLPVPGAYVTHHDEVFFKWRDLIESGDLRAPFDLVHVDSHADFGMGSGAGGRIACEFLHLSLRERAYPPSDGIGCLDCGNYLIYALANRWLRSVTYVHHPTLLGIGGQLPDIPDATYQDNSPASGYLQLKRYSKAFRSQWAIQVPRLELVEDFEPRVQVTLVRGDDATFRIDRPDYLFLAQSPNYTPVEADALAALLQRFIQEG